MISKIALKQTSEEPNAEDATNLLNRMVRSVPLPTVPKETSDKGGTFHILKSNNMMGKKQAVIFFVLFVKNILILSKSEDYIILIWMSLSLSFAETLIISLYSYYSLFCKEKDCNSETKTTFQSSPLLSSLSQSSLPQSSSSSSSSSSSFPLLSSRINQNANQEVEEEKEEELKKRNGIYGNQISEFERSLKRNLIIQRNVNEFVFKQLCDYDPSLASSLERFKAIQNKTECIFAKSAIMWGNEWNVHLDLEMNIKLCIPHLIRFTSFIQDQILRFNDPNSGKNPQLETILKKKTLDGFVIEVQNVGKYACDLNSFCSTVTKVLSILSSSDPGHIHCMDMDPSKSTWHFSFFQVPIFVTTFAPFYPETSSRYSFGVKNAAYILMQPEFSFLMNDIGEDFPLNQTNWNNPVRPRDRIRVAFKESGRFYWLPEDTIRYPVSTHIVKPLHDSDGHVQWWKK